jgi:hypothetical protein
MFSNRRILALTEFVLNSTRGFTGPQTARVLGTFTFSSDLAEALSIMHLYILGISTEEAKSVLTLFAFSSDRLDALRRLVDFVTDLENNATLVSAFQFRSDIETARGIIQNAAGRSCIYGTVTERRVQFVVDVSLSMSATFTATNGEKFTRLSFVQNELDNVIRRQLRSDQSFNVLSFAGTVVSWQPGLVPATQENIDLAVKFVGQMNFRADGTNSYEALRVALSDANVEAIYFLTDGQPTVGPVTDPARIIGFVNQWNTRNVPIHSTAFLSGFFQGDDRVAARRFMMSLANATGGVFRSIE